MPSTTTAPTARQFSSNPHDWLFSQVNAGSANHFDDMYSGYYIGPKKAQARISMLGARAGVG